MLPESFKGLPAGDLSIILIATPCCGAPFKVTEKTIWETRVNSIFKGQPFLESRCARRKESLFLN